jgi:hypothetical protein
MDFPVRMKNKGRAVKLPGIDRARRLRLNIRVDAVLKRAFGS